MAWKRPDLGLSFGFNAKGSHQETGGSVAHFKAAIAYGKGVNAAEQYHGRINAEKLSSFIRELFANMFKKSTNARGKLLLQDGDPSQNSIKCRTVWDKVGAQKFTIPARGPNLNPMENILHIVKRKLHPNAL